MFKRLSVHFVLIFLFALAQIGAATHAISHIDDFAKHNQTNQNQDDKKSHSEQCAQCLSAAQISSGAQTQPFIFHLAAAEFNVNAFNQLSYSSHAYTAYAARAPPQPL